MDNNWIEKLKNSKILVAGSTGMIGQNAVARIKELNRTDNAGITVIAHGRNEEKLKAIYGEDIKNGSLEYLVSDVADIEYDGEIDYIIHSASITGGSKQHLEFPMRTLDNAIDGTRRILNLALEKKVKGVVFLSSLESYGIPTVTRDYVKETDGGYVDPMNPRSSYPEGKRISECLFTSYAKQYGVPATVARLTASFGACASLTDNRVFAQFARSIIAGEDIVLKSTGETVRDYCDAYDVAEALLVILANGTPGEAYNVANMDTEISIRDLAKTYVELYPESGSKLVFDLKEDARNLGYNPTMRTVLSSEKLMNIGWKPKYGIEDMIKHLVESMKSRM